MMIVNVLKKLKLWESDHTGLPTGNDKKNHSYRILEAEPEKGWGVDKEKSRYRYVAFTVFMREAIEYKSLWVWFRYKR